MYKIIKNVYKIRFRRDHFETCNIWAKRKGFSVVIKFLSPMGCLPLPIDVKKKKKKKSDFKEIFMPRHQKVAGYYVIPFEILSVRPSVSAHHHSCIGNSSYSFRPILLKLYRCFQDGLKICILFFQNPEIIFYHFFPFFNLDISRALILQICIWSMYLVSATPPTVFGQSFWNFTGVLRMVWRYAYCFFRILKLFFITFFAFLT